MHYIVLFVLYPIHGYFFTLHSNKSFVVSDQFSSSKNPLSILSFSIQTNWPCNYDYFWRKTWRGYLEAFFNYVDKSLAFFDHLPPYVDISYLIRVSKKSTFLDYLPTPPSLVNVVKECSLAVNLCLFVLNYLAVNVLCTSSNNGKHQGQLNCFICKAMIKIVQYTVSS